MKSKHKFTPGQVNPLEDRALLSGFKFPAAMGPVNTLNFRGAFVLTSRTYGDVQNTVNKAILAFERDVARAFQRTNGDTVAFDKVVGTGTLGTGPKGGYAPGSLLAKLDSIMVRAEGRLPFGRGLAGTTGGVGLSTQTSLTSANPAAASAFNLSVPELMDNALLSAATTQEAAIGMEQVRQETLNIVGNAPLAQAAGVVPGILPGYVVAFGPGGERLFGLKNS